MNNQALLDHPELTIEYREGVASRQRHECIEACPYGLHLMFERSLFLAGWHDTDMGKAAQIYRRKAA